MPASTIVSAALPGATEQPFLGSNPRRTALLFCAPSASITYVRPDPLGNIAGGIPIPTGSAPIQLTLREHGDLIKGPWFAYTVANAQFAAVETLD